MDTASIPAHQRFFVLFVWQDGSQDIELLILDNTQYGTLLLVFRDSQEVEAIGTMFQRSIEPGSSVRAHLVAAVDIEGVLEKLNKVGLLPKAQPRVALEGTHFYDEVVAQLLTGSLWVDETTFRK